MSLVSVTCLRGNIFHYRERSYLSTHIGVHVFKILCNSSRCMGNHGSVVAYQPWQCCHLPTMAVLSPTNHGGIVAYQPWQCCHLPTMAVLSPTNHGSVVTYQPWRCCRLPTCCVFLIYVTYIFNKTVFL